MVTEKLDQPESGIGLGLVKGLAVTLKAMLRPAMTQAVPAREAGPARLARAASSR